MTTPLPDASEIWLETIQDAVVSDIQGSGYFDKVNQHEPKRAPGFGLTAAVWMQQLVPVPAGSGLDRTSALLVMMARFYSLMIGEPQDMIDVNLMKSTSNVIRRYHDNFDFDLDPLVRNIDIFGSAGVPFRVDAGYVEQDGTMFRVMDLTIPIIVNDVWIQST